MKVGFIGLGNVGGEAFGLSFAQWRGADGS